MFCTKCGKEQLEGMKFCGQCGQEVFKPVNADLTVTSSAVPGTPGTPVTPTTPQPPQAGMAYFGTMLVQSLLQPRQHYHPPHRHTRTSSGIVNIIRSLIK